MKKEKNERFLIHENREFFASNHKTLEEIFKSVLRLKVEFFNIGVSFSRDTFLKTLQTGAGWIADSLFAQATSIYQNLSPLIRQKMADRERFSESIAPVDKIVQKVKELTNQLSLPVENIPFDEENNPIVTEDLKKFLQDQSRQYAENEQEIKIFQAVENFIQACNKLEALLTKAEFPQLFSGEDEFCSLFANIDYEGSEERGHAVLKINPFFLSDCKAEKARVARFWEDRRKAGERMGVIIPADGEKISAAPLHVKNKPESIPRNAFSKKEEKPAAKKKGRWSGIKGATQ